MTRGTASTASARQANTAERLFVGLPDPLRPLISAAFLHLPPIAGRPIRVGFRPWLTAHQGRLLSNQPKGETVYAGSFLRQRRMVIDSELIPTPDNLVRIFIHEVFHFVWVRLGNPERRSFEALLAEEMEAGAPGELGWSAELRKTALDPCDLETRSRRWREYACESFCDTAAWRISGLRRHKEFTLPGPFRRSRRAWFSRFLSRAAISI